MKIRTLILAIACTAAVPAWALEGPAAAATGMAPAFTTPALTPLTKSKDVHLGKVEVTGLQPLAAVLQEVKVAVKRPFDNDPAHFDDMVCRLGDNALGSHITRTLECGTQGWFAMRRNSFMFGNFMVKGAAVAVSTLGHPWHTMRELNPRQIAVLRELLRELPPPGQGLVEVVDEGQAPLESIH